MNNVKRHVKPKDFDDLLALKHDIDYSGADTYEQITSADENMIKMLNNSRFGINPSINHEDIMRGALRMKTYYNGLMGLLGLSPIPDKTNYSRDYESILKEFEEENK